MKLLRPFIMNPVNTGAIAPSSRSLALKMVEWVNWDTAKHVVEYGPGTGVITKEIVNKLSDEANFLSIEYDSTFSDHIRKILPEVTLVQDSVENISKICADRGIESLDAVVSGIPWANFGEEFQNNTMDATRSLLKPGGQFVTFAYPHGVRFPTGRRFKKLLHKHFSSVEESDMVWANLPPAFVYRCTK